MSGLGGIGRGSMSSGAVVVKKENEPSPGGNSKMIGFGFHGFTVDGRKSADSGIETSPLASHNPYIGVGGVGRGNLAHVPQASSIPQPGAVGSGDGFGPKTDFPKPVASENEMKAETGDFTPHCTICSDMNHTARACPQRPNICVLCLQTGHRASDCSNTPKCLRCGQLGHSFNTCPKKEEDALKPKNYIPSVIEDDDLFTNHIEVGQNFAEYLSKVEKHVIEVQKSGRDVPPPISSFAQMNLIEKLSENITKSRYDKLTPVQCYSMPVITAKRDLMACAQTGSGKTAAFLLPILNRLLSDDSVSSPKSEPIAIILSPTRELAVQTNNECRKFCLGTSIKTVVLYGGTSAYHQRSSLRDGCHVLVGTPGRVEHFAKEGHISLTRCQFLVLDEADRMLDLGFEPNVRYLVEQSSMPSKTQRQTLMFSATFPDEVQMMAKQFLNDFIMIAVGDIGSPNPDVKQHFIKAEQYEKRDKLLELLTEDMEKYKDESGNFNLKTLVFVERKRNADFLASSLSSTDFRSTSIHGDRTQQQREDALAEFKSGKSPILIATAVCARGLDIKGVDHVINYDLPHTIDDYVHRIGRTGRVGNPGRSTSLYDEQLDKELAPHLVKNLAQAQQPVPDWLDDTPKAPGEGFADENDGSVASNTDWPKGSPF